MRKIIAIVLAVALTVGAAFVFFKLVDNPEKHILGKWTNAGTNNSFEFFKDGKVKFPVEALELQYNYEGDVEGEYAIDKSESKITFIFSFFGDNYNETYNFDIKNNALTLRKQANSEPMVYLKNNK